MSVNPYLVGVEKGMNIIIKARPALRNGGSFRDSSFKGLPNLSETLRKWWKAFENHGKRCIIYIVPHGVVTDRTTTARQRRTE